MFFQMVTLSLPTCASLFLSLCIFLAFSATWRFNWFSFFVPLHFRRISLVNPLRRHPNMQAATLTEQIAALSSISRATCRHKMSIQRLAPVFPPVISADNRHKLQFVPIKS
ncbi:MAG: hypothetical protein GC179_21345 [Anaerolineaceae bacterium]|nr:hypothetical protein [Anaerolineaceae bacterium]